MNKTIKSLTAKLNKQKSECEKEVGEIQTKLQAAWNEVFYKDAYLKKVILELDNSNEYVCDEYGDVFSWTRFNTEDYSECLEYLEQYLDDSGYRLDVKNDSLMVCHGDDNIMIQDDTRHDNGIWQGQKLVIKESEYRSEDGEIDIKLRNELIEKHMELTGLFPGVFRVTQYGDIFPVSTLKVEVAS